MRFLPRAPSPTVRTVSLTGYRFLPRPRTGTHPRKPRQSGRVSLVSAIGRMVGACLRIVVRMLTVDDTSALARWAEPGLLRRVGPPVEVSAREWATTSSCALDDSILRAARLEATVERPLHVLVSHPGERINSRRIVSHVWSTPLPHGALYQLMPQVLIASPSFCLQSLSAGHSLVKAIVSAMEVCGDYGRTPNARDGFVARPALARPEDLRAHFRQNHSYGARRVREALGHVVAGSRSPMETIVVLVFTLPVELGGCGLPSPLLNVRLEIPPELQRAIGKPYVVVDLCWPDQLIILEYDSYLWHSSALAVDSDSTRNEGLRDEGWMVRSVTAGMLANDAMRRHLVSKVTGRFGIKLPNDPEFDRRQHDLIQELLRC